MSSTPKTITFTLPPLPTGEATVDLNRYYTDIDYRNTINNDPAVDSILSSLKAVKKSLWKNFLQEDAVIKNYFKNAGDRNVNEGFKGALSKVCVNDIFAFYTKFVRYSVDLFLATGSIELLNPNVFNRSLLTARRDDLKTLIYFPSYAFPAAKKTISALEAIKASGNNLVSYDSKGKPVSLSEELPSAFNDVEDTYSRNVLQGRTINLDGEGK